MATVNDIIVREYFENLGFLVRQPCKHTVPGRQKTAEESFDLIVVNPRAPDSSRPSGRLVWNGEDVKGIARAVVVVRGWHTERFYASTFDRVPDILQAAAPDVLEHARAMIGDGPLATVLCLPRLPASDEFRERMLDYLGGKGVDGILTFETMLIELAAAVDVNRNYEHSDLLQTIRILKNYGLLRGRQLDFFDRRPRG